MVNQLNRSIGWGKLAKSIDPLDRPIDCVIPDEPIDRLGSIGYQLDDMLDWLDLVASIWNWSLKQSTSWESDEV